MRRRLPQPRLSDALDPGGGPRDGDGATDLNGPPDLQRLHAKIAATRFAGLGHVFDSVGSTNDAAHELGTRNAPSGTFVLAAEQRLGRGRQRRRWVSPPGRGLFLSILLRAPQGPPTRWTLGAAVAACDACRALGAETTAIKWPNDLLIEGEKVGGILVETRSAGTTTRELILGIGINVHHTDEEIVKLGIPAVTSLRRSIGSGMVGGRTRLAAEFLRRLDDIGSRLDSGDWDAVADEWARRAPGASAATVRIVPADGTPWVGTSAGLAPDGALRVLDGNGRVHEIRQTDSVRFTEV